MYKTSTKIINGQNYVQNLEQNLLLECHYILARQVDYAQISRITCEAWYISLAENNPGTKWFFIYP